MRYGAMTQIEDRLQDEQDYIDSIELDLFYKIGKEMYRNLSNTVRARELWNEFRIDRTEYSVTVVAFSEEEFKRKVDKLEFYTRSLDDNIRKEIHKIFNEEDIKDHKYSINDKVYI